MDLSQQVRLQQEIKDILESQRELLDKMSSSMCEQARCSKEIQQAAQKSSTYAQRNATNAERTQRALERSAQNARDATEESQELSGAIEDASDEANSLSDTLGSVLKGGLALGGLVSVFNPLPVLSPDYLT